MATAQNKDVRVVGLGASAGGLEAFEHFFLNTPLDARLSIIVVQHLPPDSKSVLAEILQRYTDLPVIQVTTPTRMEPNHVYVIPPDHDIGVIDGEIQLFEPSVDRVLRLPVDFLFRSIAEAFGAKAAGVVLRVQVLMAR